jgi:hypothetical protein
MVKILGYHNGYSGLGRFGPHASARKVVLEGKGDGKTNERDAHRF